MPGRNLEGSVASAALRLPVLILAGLSELVRRDEGAAQCEATDGSRYVNDWHRIYSQ